MIDDYVSVEAIKIKSNNRLNVDVEASKCNRDGVSDRGIDVEAINVDLHQVKKVDSQLQWN